jgi:formylglycine-generating enzyme required for sulfatase activity
VGAPDVAPLADAAVIADAAAADTALDLPAACAPPPAPVAWAGWPITAPDARHYEIGAETVADQTTHLMWQRRAAAQDLAWDDARAYCSCLSVGGFHDWRLPSRMELLSIVDYRRQDPSIDPAVFPDTRVTWFWTASPVAGQVQLAWYLSFMDGNTHEASTDVTYAVRCVRQPAVARGTYQLAAGIVVDPATHLTWQAAADPAFHTWDEARDHCAGLALAGGGWRLPTMFELQTLIDESATEPAIDTRAFPDTPPEGFWAATPLAGMPGYWFVSFDRGIAYNAVAEHPYHARCVR